MNIRFWQRREAARVYQSIQFANHARTEGDTPESVKCSYGRLRKCFLTSSRRRRYLSPFASKNAGFGLFQEKASRSFFQASQSTGTHHSGVVPVLILSGLPGLSTRRRAFARPIPMIPTPFANIKIAWPRLTLFMWVGYLHRERGSHRHGENVESSL